MTHFNNQGPVSNQVGYQEVRGNVNHYHSYHPSPEEPTPNFDLGLRLGNAPQINEEDFIGREVELTQLQEWLAPRPKRQNVVAVYGLGGMGKTQLSMQFVKKFGDSYSAVFWLNAKDEVTVKTGLAGLGMEVSEDGTGQSVSDAREEERRIQQARQWLSRPGNEKWLVIYDNYDDPHLPGIPSSTGYDIRNFFPHRAQGSILITTRSPRIGFAKPLQLKKLEDTNQRLKILGTRSGREVDGDPEAAMLAQRLDGLPLALATAGTYLSQTADSFRHYLQQYNKSWNDLDKYSPRLLDYEDRTLYSTWNLLLAQIRHQDTAAAELLRLMAYLDNQDLWYEFFQAGAQDRPKWWSEVVKSRARFNRAMSTLHNYSLVDVKNGSYSLHTCVHDWTLEYLNQDVDDDLSRLAIQCVARNMKWETEAEYWVTNRRVIQHAHRLQHARLRASIDWNNMKAGDLSYLANLYKQFDFNAAAQDMCMRALRGKEKAWGAEHTSTLDTVNSLGILYKKQGKMAEAEAMYMRALRGKEKAWGAEHTSTLDTVNNLGILYADKGKMAEAEAMYMRALRGKEKAWGAEHTSTLDTVNNLGNLYKNQGKMAEAEAMYMRALQGYEKAWGAEHTSTLDTVNNLGNLYKNQGKMAEAEAMYMRALRGKEKAWGAGHTSTLDTVNNLGNLYADQGKMAEAEAMYMRALRGKEKAWGAEHTSTLSTVNNLGNLYADQGKMAEAEAMYIRALRGYEKGMGADHPRTQRIARNLDHLHATNRKR